MKNTDLFPKCKCNQYVKDRTFEGMRFSLSARQSYDAFFKQYGDNIYEKPSLSGDNESVEIDRER